MLVLSELPLFLYFIRNILPKIVIHIRLSRYLRSTLCFHVVFSFLVFQIFLAFDHQPFASVDEMPNRIIHLWSHCRSAANSIKSKFQFFCDTSILFELLCSWKGFFNYFTENLQICCQICRLTNLCKSTLSLDRFQMHK